MSERSAGRSSGSNRAEVETKRSYRTPHSSTTPSDVELIEPMKRQGHGTKGELINLLINWYRIRFNKMRIYIYKVIMVEASSDSRGRGGGRGGRPTGPPPEVKYPINSKVLWKIVREYRDIFLNWNRYVFDDSDLLFSPDRIKMNEDKGLNLVCDHPEKEGKRVSVSFKCEKMFDLDLMGRIDKNEDTQWTSMFLKNLISQHSRYAPPNDASQEELEVANRFAHFNGGMFFIPRTPNSPKVTVQPGVESWLGLYASVRTMENFDPVINFGDVNKLFVQMNLDLVNLYVAIENDSLSGRRTSGLSLHRDIMMTPPARDKFTFKLKDLKVKCDCVPGTDKDGIVVARVERHYKFIELVLKTADQLDIDVEDTREPRRMWREFPTKQGIWKSVMRQWRTMKLDEWYNAQGRPIQYPRLPLCKVKSGKKEDLLPMEVLFTHDRPQKYTKLLDFYAKMKITQLLAKSPVDHHRHLNKTIDKLKYGRDPFMNAMQISLDTTMIECEGRKVDACAVLGKSVSDESIVKLKVNEEKGDFFLEKALETSDKHIRFVVFHLTEEVEKKELQQFYRELVKKCLQRGFIIPSSDHLKPPIYHEIPRDHHELGLKIEETMQMFEQSGKLENEIPVLLFFTRIVDDLYGEIKYRSDIVHGIVTQVVDSSTVKKACTKLDEDTPSDYKSVYHHLCLKLNAKLGGVNQILDEPDESDEPEWGRMPSHEKTMFIGIDVIHPSPNSPIRDLSLAAIVGSVDKDAAKYAVRIKVNGRCNETVQCFDAHFSHLLLKYHTRNEFFPDRVVILRDGVSDSEMINTASVELNSIKKAWKSCSNGRPFPSFTYIVVQKRHKTRFYRKPSEEGGDVSNPPMGTIVDKGTVNPHMFDFYMVSHYTLLGTTKPIHYTVVYDDCQSSPDVVQEMIFRMCFLYARCSKPVSLPSPVYYAHLACERAAFQHQYAIKSGEIEEIMDKREMETDQQYATRVEMEAMRIEEKLQVSDKYPGMHFI